MLIKKNSVGFSLSIHDEEFPKRRVPSAIYNRKFEKKKHHNQEFHKNLGIRVLSN